VEARAGLVTGSLPVTLERGVRDRERTRTVKHNTS
jgi:hypothetical protein